MKTIIYNTDTGAIESHHPDGYKVNGRPQPVEDPLFELPYTDTPQPTGINDETHYATSRYVVDMALKQYRQVWEVKERPPAPPPSTDIETVIQLLIKKTVDGVALTEEEIALLKSYNTTNS